MKKTSVALRNLVFGTEKEWRVSGAEKKKNGGMKGTSGKKKQIWKQDKPPLLIYSYS